MSEKLDRTDRFFNRADEIVNRIFDGEGEKTDSKIDGFADELHNFISESKGTEAFERLGNKFNEVTTNEDGSDIILEKLDKAGKFMENVFEKVDNVLGLFRI